jgi:ABC-type transport system involved in multi-copper enzyme maturation permease subunit
MLMAARVNANLVVGGLAGGPLVGQHLLSGGGLLLTLVVVALAIAGTFFLVRAFVGPVLFYDLVRIGRQRRYLLLRFLSVVGLTSILGWVYFLWRMELTYRPDRAAPSIQDVAQLAETLFYTFAIVQLFVVAILTPAYTAGAIADEKDRKTLEFILATDLRNREIVLSKLLARVFNMLMIILAGLPILSFMQFFGGIEPDLLLAVMAALVVTMLSLASLGIFTSVYTRKARDAIVLTYLTAAVYLSISVLLRGLVRFSMWGYADWPSTDDWTSPVTLRDLVEWLNAGNLFVAIFNVGAALSSGQRLSEVLPDILAGYVIFHAIVIVVCCTWAVLRVRAVALKEVEVKGPGRLKSVGIVAGMIGLLLIPLVGWAALLWLRPWRQLAKARGPARPIWFGSRPAVTAWPMIWKETIAEPGLRFNWMGRIIVMLLLIVCFLPAGWIIIDFFVNLVEPQSYTMRYGYGGNITAHDLWMRLGENMNIWVRFASTLLGSLMLLGVAVRAAGSISGERDKQTLDALLTSPLSCNAILFGKWLGSILSVRLGWIALALIWALGVLTGGLHILGLILAAIAWLVYAAVFAGVGMFFSATSRTSLRASIWTLLTVVAMGGGHWLLSIFCCFMPLAIFSRGGKEDFAEFIVKFQAGQTPVAALWILPFQGYEFSGEYNSKDWWHFTISSVFGVFCWALLFLVLWHLASQRFQRACGRDAYQWTGRGKGLRRPATPVGAVTPAAAPAPELRGAVLLEEVRPEDDDLKRRPS